MSTARVLLILILFCGSVIFSPKLFADWTTDFTPPPCSIRFSPDTPQLRGTAITVYIDSTDPSGITSAALQIPPFITTNQPSGYVWNTSAAWTSSSYTVNAQVKDGAGNTSSCSKTFTFSAAPPPSACNQTVRNLVSCLPGPTNSGNIVSVTWAGLDCPVSSYTAEVSNNRSFAGGYYYKSGLGGSTTSGTTIPDGGFFRSTDGSRFTLIPDTTYFVRRRLDGTSTVTDPLPFSVSSCPAPPAPTISLLGISCLPATGSTNPDYTVGIYWANPIAEYAVDYIDISTNPAFPSSNYYNKAVPTTTTKSAAPVGFRKWSNPWSASNPYLVIYPGTTYYVRTYSSASKKHSTAANFTIPLCPPPITPPPATAPPTTPPTPPSIPTNLVADCSAPGTSATLWWSAVPGAAYYNYKVGSYTVNNFRSSENPVKTNYTTTPGNTYDWSVQACSTPVLCSGWKNGTRFTCAAPPAALDAWIKSSGDVHSNTGIEAPGGP